MGVITKIVEFETLEAGDVFKLKSDDAYMKLEEAHANEEKYNSLNVCNGSFVYVAPGEGVILFKALKEEENEN